MQDRYLIPHVVKEEIIEENSKARIIDEKVLKV